MGKPSSSTLSRKRRSSSNSSRSNMSKPITTPKMLVSKKKNNRRHRHNIKKVFEHLRNQTTIIDNSLGSTYTLDNTLEDDTVTPVNNKRKSSPEPMQDRKKSKLESVIVINDDDSSSNEKETTQDIETPKKKCNIQCSTPIIQQDSKTLNDLLVNSFPKNNNSNTIQNFNEDVVNLTTDINPDSFYTIDLTDNDSTNNVLNESQNDTEQMQNTVIDLINTTDVQESSIISVKNIRLPDDDLSEESNATAVRKHKSKKHLHKIAKGIAAMNSTEKDHILEFITKTIFNGCNVSKKSKKGLTENETVSDKESNAENEYIKQMLVGPTPSNNNSVGSNVYHPNRGSKSKSGLRMIVIDGSNVAMEHGKGRYFSVEGLKICIDYFIKRGHTVKAFVPRFRCKNGKSTNPMLLEYLKKQGTVIYTPSREVKGRIIVPYDDRYIIQCAAEFDGIIVTGDNYKDLVHENSKWRYVIENCLLPFTWVDDMIMFPRDPLGRCGPTLEQFLRHPSSKHDLRIT